MLSVGILSGLGSWWFLQKGLMLALAKNTGEVSATSLVQFSHSLLGIVGGQAGSGNLSASSA